MLLFYSYFETLTLFSIFVLDPIPITGFNNNKVYFLQNFHNKWHWIMKMSLNWYKLCRWFLSRVLDDVPPFPFVSLNILPRYFVSFHFFTNTFIDGSIQWLKVRKVLVLGQRLISGKWSIQRDAHGLCQSLMCVISAFLPRETIPFRDHGKENASQVEPVVS